MILRFLLAICLLMAVPTWIAFAGSYSIARDVVGIIVVTSAMLFLFVRRTGRQPGRIVPAIASMFRPLPAFTWMLACWVALSSMDRIFTAPPLPLTGKVMAPEGVRADLEGKRIALALSGGGYRAALLHAGVVMQLNELGVPVTNVASVSGGSIIGAFVAAGGDPAQFVDAVRSGRFRLKRELTSAFELPRWLLPFTDYTRRDVQAAMLRRTLLPVELESGRGPEIMIAMTDLTHVMSVGWTREGLMFAGPTTSRFYRLGDVIETQDLGDLADIAAISGSFPGAFPAKPVSVKFSREGLPLSEVRDVASMNLVLSDGGVRDNLGLKLLTEADAQERGTANTARNRSSLKPGPQWALDAIIVSDGGAAMSADPDVVGPIDEAFRAIDIASLETGAIRLIDSSKGPPKRVLSLPGLITLFPDSEIAVLPDPARAGQRYFFVRPSTYDDKILDLIASLPPRDLGAVEAKKDFVATGDAPINKDVDELCQYENSKESDKASCTWWRMVTAIGTDVEFAANVFRSSSTLRDDYSEEEVDAIIRLGRYFVLLSWPQLDACLSAIGQQKPDARLICLE